MKFFAFLLLVLTATAWTSAQTITQAEYFVDIDPGAGFATPLSVTPGASVPLSFGFDTDGWLPGLHHVFVRCYSDNGAWSAPTPVLLFTSPSVANPGADITDVEYWFDNQTPTPADVSDGNPVSLSFHLSSAGLAPGLHRFYLRAHDAEGRWGVPASTLFSLHGPSASSALVTEVEYWFDQQAPTLVDVPDGNLVNLNFLLATTSLDIGLHHLFVRTHSNDSTWGAPTAVLLAVHPDLAPVPLLVSQAEYWFDDDPSTVVDLPDANPVNLDYLLPTAGLEIGLHRYSIRILDENGRWGMPHSAFLIVSSPFDEPQVRTLTAAEYFVNVDPGPGNGVPIPLPEDDVWDEGEESTLTVLTGLPSGYHRFGLRVRDDLGRWSPVIGDTVTVGPLLTIRLLAGEVVLDWVADPGAAPYHVYRADQSNGLFTEIASTPDHFYTDTGTLAANLKKFYYITQTNNGLCTRFRLPDRRSITPSRE